MLDKIVVPTQEIKDEHYQVRNNPFALIEFDDEQRVKRNAGASTHFNFVMSTSTYLHHDGTSQEEFKQPLEDSNEKHPLLANYYHVATFDGSVFALTNVEQFNIPEDKKEQSKEILDFITKTAAEVLLQYDSAESFNEKASAALETIQTKLRQQYPKAQIDNLVAGRTFKTDKGYQVVGFNLGKTCCVAYHPKKKIFNNIVSASPEAGESLCKTFDQSLDEGTYILPLTAAATEFLPRVTVTQPIPLTFIDAKKMQKHLKIATSLYECVTTLMRITIGEAEVLRTKSILPSLDKTIEPLSSVQPDKKAFSFGGDAVVAGFKLITKQEQAEYRLALFKQAVETQYVLHHPQPTLINNNENNNSALTPKNILEHSAWNNIEKFIAQFGLGTTSQLLNKLESGSYWLNTECRTFARNTLKEYIVTSIYERDEKKLKEIAKNTHIDILSNLLIQFSKQTHEDKPIFSVAQLQFAQRTFYQTAYDEQLVKRAANKEKALFWGSFLSWTGFVPLVMYFWYNHQIHNEEIQIRNASMLKPTIPRSNVIQRMSEMRTSDEREIPQLTALLEPRPSLDASRSSSNKDSFLHNNRALKEITVEANNPHRLFVTRAQAYEIDAQQSCCFGFTK